MISLIDNPHRLRRIGASECAAALGRSPYETPLRLWQRLTGRAPRFDATDSGVTRRGKRLQNACLDEYAEANRVRLLREGDPNVNLFTVHPALDFLCCSPDAICLVEPVVGIDAKTVGGRAEGWGTPGTDEIPEPYWWQCQHSLLVSGAAAWDVAALFGGRGFEFAFYRVERDPALLDRLAARLAEWWATHVVGDEPPEPISRAELAAISPNVEADLIDAREDAEVNTAFLRAVDAKRGLDDADAENEAAQFALCRLIGIHDGIRTAAGYATWKANKNGVRSLRIHPNTIPKNGDPE